jgi:hypothetical protein
MRGKKTGGRTKGAPNKATGDVRRLFAAFTESKFTSFKNSYEKIKDPEKKCRIYIDACKYVIPSLQSVTIDDITDRDKTIEDRLAELSEEANG